MKLFIFGSRGMAGHMLEEYFIKETEYAVYSSSREKVKKKNHFKIDVLQHEQVINALNKVKPDVIINCTGILNEQAERQLEIAYIVNGIFPHRLVEWANDNDAKVVQISTDCVFKGDRGNYVETDKPDGITTYALTKRLGELLSEPHITIRTSIIGPELKQDGVGLFQWFMKQSGKVYGYKNALWNGMTTLQLAKVIHEMLERNGSGLYHIAAAKEISKYELLNLIQFIFQKNNVKILPSTTPVIDRTLSVTRKDFYIEIPDYETMLKELKEWMNNRGY